jgi:hypothetical protein
MDKVNEMKLTILILLVILISIIFVENRISKRKDW